MCSTHYKSGRKTSLNKTILGWGNDLRSGITIGGRSDHPPSSPGNPSGGAEVKKRGICHVMLEYEWSAADL